MRNTVILLLAALTISIGFAACVKKDFDPPAYAGDLDPNVPVNTTIKDLKSRYNVAAGGTLVIDEELTISGIVTSSDETGNFYKQIIIQDSTAAIPVKIDRNDLYTEFPVGRKVYVKCKGLSLGEYGDFIQLGLGQDSRGNLGDIPNAIYDNYIINGPLTAGVEPTIVEVKDLNVIALSQDLLGMLVKIERVQVADVDRGKNFGEDPNLGSSGENRIIESCDGSQIILRNSNYASFWFEPMPDGSGSLVGIYSRFNNDAQILIRNTDDLNFDMGRCPFGSPTDTLMRIADLRNMYSGTAVQVNNRKIRGVVISDPDDVVGNNITSKNMVLQDGDRGIVVRFGNSADNNWAMGDSLEIVISGQTLSEFGRLLQIGDQVALKDVQRLGTGNVTPREATISQIIANFEDWESTLITIKNANVVSASNSSGFYQGTVLINDGSTSTDFPMFTQSYAKFANVPAPVGQTKDITGFLYSITSTDRISIRNLNDIKP